MATYALWNNKGGVGKSYLSFQLSCEFARANPDKKVLVLDMCPQANVSGILLGGMDAGEQELERLSQQRKTIAEYIEARILSPYMNPQSGATLLHQVSLSNASIPDNLYLICGDEQLEIQSSRVAAATQPGPQDAWRLVHTWISDLIRDIRNEWDDESATVFVDCNPSFSIYTELALSASDRLIIPFSADGSSKRAVRAVLSLIYGVTRYAGAQQSQYFINSSRFRMSLPAIYCYVGNRLTQYVKSAAAFRTVVSEIGDEIWAVWQANPNRFCLHPNGQPAPTNKRSFQQMFQYEVVDANTASVVSSAKGIPIYALASGNHVIAGKKVRVNQSQLDVQRPNISSLTTMIE